MSAYQSGAELQEVPFRPCGFQNLVRVDADALENDAQLVDEGDVDVALRVFDDLGGLSHLDAGRAVGARLDDEVVGPGDVVGTFSARPAHDLDDGLDGVDLVPGVDALRAVADFEIFVEFQPADFFQYRYAIVFRAAGVNRGFVHHVVARFQRGANGRRRT